MGTVVVAAVLVCVVGLILKGMHKDKKNGRIVCYEFYICIGAI